MSEQDRAMEVGHLAEELFDVIEDHDTDISLPAMCYLIATIGVQSEGTGDYTKKWFMKLVMDTIESAYKNEKARMRGLK